MKNISPLYLLLLFVWCGTGCGSTSSPKEKKKEDSAIVSAEKTAKPESQTLNSAAYDSLMKVVANGDTTGRWPVKGPYPKAGALLPFNRIVAYYGNLYSKRMGALGEYPKPEMFQRLKGEVAKWQAADTTIPVIPALHYIAVVEQGAAGRDGKYRLRMPFSQIDTIVNWANEINALVFLDIQVGHSSVKAETPQFEPYLKMPKVHFAIDPEFSMKGGERPGSRIGTFNAEDINDAIDFLADVVKKNNLPPKILVVHRFTTGMVRGAQNIKKVPEVQVVIDMDGFGDKILKRSTWLRDIYNDPVQFAGFKLFYKNDIKTGADQFFTPQELLKFTPKPVYIQYQ